MITTSSAMSKTSHSPCSEEPTPNTEFSLMMNFEMALLDRSQTPDSTTRILLRELNGLQGRADLVDAHIRALPSTVRPEDLATSLRSPAKARLLANLRYRAPRTRAYLMRATGLSNRSLGGHIRQLESSGLVNVHANLTVSLGCRLPWSMVDIVAYEAKLANWRRALHQALGYRAFSRSVWVVMPTSGARNAKKLANVFSSNGIGLMAIDNEGRIQIEIKSRRHRRPTSRRLYLMAVGAILNEFLGEKEFKLPNQT